MTIRNDIKSSLEKTGLLESLKGLRSMGRNYRLKSEEFFYRLPDPLYKRVFAKSESEIQLAENELRENGIAVLREHFKGEKLSSLQRKFQSMIESIEKQSPPEDKLTPPGGRLHERTPYKEYGHDEIAKITYTNDPFHFGNEFLEVALDEAVLSVIESYIRKKFMLQQSTASRYYPLGKTGFGSFQWHHDSWGRKINVMVLLTDVGENDQYMSFLMGSHKLFHSYEKTVENDRFTETEISKMPALKNFKCLGKAGTVFIFDANGIHSGNRTTGAVRDTIINQYTAGRYLWPFRIPTSFKSALNDKQISFLMNNPNVEWIHD